MATSVKEPFDIENTDHFGVSVHIYAQICGIKYADKELGMTEMVTWSRRSFSDPRQFIPDCCLT